MSENVNKSVITASNIYVYLLMLYLLNLHLLVQDSTTSLTAEQGGGASITPSLQTPLRVTPPQQTRRHSGSGCCCSLLPSQCTTSLRGWLWASVTPLQALHLLLLTKVPGNNSQIPCHFIVLNTHRYQFKSPHQNINVQNIPCSKIGFF